MTTALAPEREPPPPRASLRPLLGRMGGARGHWWLIAAALILVSPALSSGMALDDDVLALLSRPDAGVIGLHSHPFLLFSFTSGRADDVHALIDHGVLLPWWSDPHHLNAFFRPLSALSHRLDFALWPDQPLWMHVHSLLWFALLLLVVAHVYRTLAPPNAKTAVVAFALFALDGAHGMTVTWIANRNALIAAALALPAVSAHHRLRAHGWKPGAYLGPLCFAFGLLAGETAVAVFAYLIAYAVALDRGPVVQRALRLAPYVALLALWRATFAWLGLGSSGSGAYHDPGREPLGYALALIHHLPVLLSAQLGLPLADVWFWGPPEFDRPIWVLSVLTLLGLLLLGHRKLGHDREARFWMIGMLLSGCAVAASVPGERLLLVPGIGGSAFLAKLLYTLWPRSAARSLRAHAEGALCGVLVLVHLVGAPVMLPVRAWSMHVLRDAIERADRGIPSTPDIAGKTVVIVNAPFDLMVSYLQLGRAMHGVPRPRHLYWLATASSPIEVRTLDAQTLRVHPKQGFLFSPPERHYRADPSTLSVGTSVVLSDMTVRIAETTADHRPAVADFHFSTPLDASSRLFLRWQDGQLLPFSPPPPGGSAYFPRESFFTTLSKQAFGSLSGS